MKQSYTSDGNDPVSVLKKTIVSTESCACPRIPLLSLQQEHELLWLASYNKAFGNVFHYIHCASCSRHISVSFMKQLMGAEFTANSDYRKKAEELRTLRSVVSRGGHTAVFYKTSPFQPGFVSRDSVSSDIDVLVSRSVCDTLVQWYTNRGYALRRYPPKEYTVSHPRSGIRIDIHTLVAYPHFGDMSRERIAMMERLTRDMLIYTHKKNGILVSDPPYYVFYSAVNFWYNDLGFGMHTLYQIVHTLRLLSPADRRRLHAILTEYQWRTLFSFIAEAGFMFYNIPLPAFVRALSGLPPARDTYLNLFLRHFIVLRIPMDAWHRSHKQWARRVFTDMGILDTLLRDSLPSGRLLRPKIIWFMMRAALGI